MLRLKEGKLVDSNDVEQYVPIGICSPIEQDELTFRYYLKKFMEAINGYWLGKKRTDSHTR